ncbi:MAG: hypothetical protein KF865_10385 [Bdellovibrionaceae bacterium]|nr:hypothetical protein [Pseudobdellovibrionaceae bacterium]
MMKFLFVMFLSVLNIGVFAYSNAATADILHPAHTVTQKENPETLDLSWVETEAVITPGDFVCASTDMDSLHCAPELILDAGAEGSMQICSAFPDSSLL